MAIHLQSTADPTLYFNGSTLDKRKQILSMFSPITNARDFISTDEALEVSEVIKVPVNIITV